MKHVLLTSCFAAILSAQTTFEIRGMVSEPGLGGIAGAEVQATPIATEPSIQSKPLTAFTDGRGEFILRTTTAGGYVIRANRDGYGMPAPNGAVIAQVGNDRPRADVQLTMLRPAQAIGRVLDAETREPIEGIEMFALQRVPEDRGGFGWNAALVLGDPAVVRQQLDNRKTDREGRFVVAGLMPAEYVLTTVRLDSPWSTGYSAEDLKTIDRDYEPLFWPGGVRSDAARPMALGSGGVVSFGDLLLKKMPRYRVHVSVSQGACPEGESMRISLLKPGAKAATEVAPCGSELLLRGLESGSYYLYAVSDWQGERDNIEKAAWATAQFVLSEENIEVALVPQRGVVLEGQLIAAEGVKDLPQRLTLGVLPEELAPGIQPAPEQFIEWFPDHKFRMTVSPRAQRLDTRFLGNQVYLKQLRYNGVPLPGSKLPVIEGAAQHLDIVLDDKFGVLTGTYADALPQSLVLLWTDRESGPMPIAVENGTFRSRPLPPGDYRLTTTTSQELNRVFATVFDRPEPGQKVTIRPGETVTINLRRTEVDR